MIYLIGGAPRVGKSIVAKKIAETIEAAFVSTDDIYRQVTKELSEETRKEKFPLPDFSGTASENVLTPEERVELQLVCAKSLEPELDKIILQAFSRNEGLIVEGVHLLPEHVHQLAMQYGSTKLAALFIGLDDVDRVAEGIVNNTSPDNWMRESDPEVIRQVAEFVAAFSARIQKEAIKNDLSYQERTEDFEGDVNRFSESLLRDNESKLPLK